MWLWKVTFFSEQLHLTTYIYIYIPSGWPAAEHLNGFKDSWNVFKECFLILSALRIRLRMSPRPGCHFWGPQKSKNVTEGLVFPLGVGILRAAQPSSLKLTPNSPFRHWASERIYRSLPPGSRVPRKCAWNRSFVSLRTGCFPQTKMWCRQDSRKTRMNLEVS